MNPLKLCLFALMMLTSDTTPATQWLRTSDLPLREAAADERARIRESLAGTLAGYHFDDESARVLVHDGDLVVRGDFDNGDLLVVRGSLTVEGSYDDYREGIGVLVVQGDMHAHDLYSWGAIRVAGDLRVGGVLMTVYNDFSFEVAGKVDARLLLISDKSCDYRVGEIGIALTDDGDTRQYALALRQLLPEAFTGTEHFEFDPDDGWRWMPPDQEWLRQRIAEHRPVFRATPAPPRLLKQLRIALDEDSPVEALRELLTQDALLAQVIAARDGLPEELIEPLLALADPRVDEWLGKNAPLHLAGRDPHQLSAQAAQALALNAQTPPTMVAALAVHESAQVRVLVATRADLSDASLNALQADADAEVRARLWRVHAWETAFGWDPGADAIAARLADDSAGVRDAMVEADLSAAQFRVLLARLSSAGVVAFARQLWEIRAERVPSQLTPVEVDGLALELLDLPRERFANVHEHVEARTHAWLALDPVAQAERARAEIETAIDQMQRRVRPPLALPEIAEHARSRIILDRLAALLGPRETEELGRALARNRLLPLALQMLIVERAAASTAGRGEPGEVTPEVALDELLQNDGLKAEAIEATLTLILERGIRRADGSYQNSFFHLRSLPQTVIAKLDQRLGYSEDWALTLMLQEHATRAQLVRGLIRWYDDDALLQAELAAAAARDDEGFWLALAQAGSPKLREAVGHPAASAAAVQWLLDHSDSEYAWQAIFHPAMPLSAQKQRIVSVPAEQWDADWLRLPVSAWEELARSAPERAQRRVAFRRAGEGRARVVE